MGKISWARIVLCGLVTGFVWTILAVALVMMVGQEFLASVTSGQRLASRGRLLFAADLMTGVWAVWLYALIRPRFGAWPAGALVAGLAWWIIATIQSGKWVIVLGAAPRLVAPLAANVALIVVAVMAGAWCYERTMISAVSPGSPPGSSG